MVEDEGGRKTERRWRTRTRRFKIYLKTNFLLYQVFTSAYPLAPLRPVNDVTADKVKADVR